MPTEFNDDVHYALFKGPGAIRTGNSYEVRWSEITLAALRSAGFLDNMVDGTVPPVDLALLWLDKNTDPAVLKEWNPVGANWEQVTSQTLFGRVPWKGVWASPSIYRIGDIVSYQGAIWLAVQSSQNHIPAEDAYWDLFIEPVTDGAVTTTKLAAGAVTRPKLSDELADTIPLSPLAFGATGDGVTDDHVNYALAEAANGNVYLPGGETFNLAATLPTKPVYGPGSLKVNGVVIDRVGIQFDPIYTNVLFNPPVYGEQVTGDYLGRGPDREPDVFNNIVISPGYSGFPTTGEDQDFYSNTFVGHGIGALLKWSRYTDAYGADCLKWAKYSERNTIIGSLGMPWLGQDLTTDASHNPDYPSVQRYYEHDLLQDNGVLWSDVGSTVFGLKPRNATIQSQLTAWVASNPWADAYATANGGEPWEYCLRNIAVGRDALNQKVRGNSNVAVGYRAFALNLDGSFNAGLGEQAGFSNVFGNGNSAFGGLSLLDNQDGEYNTALGYRSGGGIVHGTRNVFLGSEAGRVGANSDATVDVTVERSVFLGAGAGKGYTSSTIADVLVVSNASASVRGALIAGDFANQNLAIGALPIGTSPFAGYRGAKLTVYAGVSGVGAISANADDFVIEGATTPGMTIVSPNNTTASIYFADPESAFAGYVQYNHTSEYLRFGVGASERMRLTATGMGFNGAAGIAKPSGYGAPTGTATRSAFATSTVTTAQLAERVKALIDDLTSYGLIGA